MKILIIGKNSYIGNHIDEWLTKCGHEVEQLDVLIEDWKAYDYSPYDAIVHVAGIVHRPDCLDWNLYKAVNCDMPITIAKRFKEQSSQALNRSKDLNNSENIEHLKLPNVLDCSKSKIYIYFSTMGVYDADKKLTPSVVDEKTPLHSESMYGKSKLMAEEGLLKLQDSSFNIAFVRPPSVYGKGCKGGYIAGFKKIASILPVIPRAYETACQSFIYIDNLSECVRFIIENSSTWSSGPNVFCPQDDEIPNANRLLEVICKGICKKYRPSKFLGLCLKMVSFIPLVKKAYGGVEYSRKLSDIPGMDYVVVPFEEGIRRTVEQ